MSQWTDLRHRKFADDLERAGYEVRDYGGRWGYQGPAVACSAEEFQDVLRATDVKVVWDQLGKGYIAYPDCRVRIEEQKAILNFSETLKKNFGIEFGP